VGVLAIVAVPSLTLAQWAAGGNPARNFFFAGTRMRKLLTGALAAIGMYGCPMRGKGLLAGAGLAMILGAMFVFNGQTPFRSRWTLVPVAVTVLMIVFAGLGKAVARRLSWRGCLGIGLISYSANVWRQPVFSLARIPVAGLRSGRWRRSAGHAGVGLGLGWSSRSGEGRRMGSRRWGAPPDRSLPES